MTNPGGLDTAAARRHLLTERWELLERIVDCADAVAAAWDDQVGGLPATIDRGAVRAPLEAALERAGVLGELPAVLRECVAAGGGSLSAPPVASPPYVVVTSTGPTLRATLPEGRFVVRFEVVAVENGIYLRSGSDPAEIVDVGIF